MKTILACTLAGLTAAGLSYHLSAQDSPAALRSAAFADREHAASISLDQIGATAEKQYSGDGLCVFATEGGARLRCVSQKMEGEVTRKGLWLTSMVTNTVNDRFRVMACSVGRISSDQLALQKRQQAPRTPSAGATVEQLPDSRSVWRAFWPSAKILPALSVDGCDARCGAKDSRSVAATLPAMGTVTIAGKVARFIRPGLIEEYSVSMDGVRQDFIIERRPESEGELRVELAVTGARVEQTAFGTRLMLDDSGRKIGYSRLRVADATGRELPARLEVVEEGARRSRRFDSATTKDAATTLSATDLPVLKRPECRAPALLALVNDAGAVYPLRIDPTFSDDNWISMGGIPGANDWVYAAAADSSGNLYIGGNFTIVGNVFATNVAKWNGSSWSALGLGLNGVVYALAVSGSDVYVGGGFTRAGGVTANRIAKWSGNSWSVLGSGMGGDPSSTSVYALAASGSNLYAGGNFTTAGGNAATNVAKWNGSSWAALGSGIGGVSRVVSALAASGSDLYAGGYFTNAGGVAANNIAKWNGTNWSALGSGMSGGAVEALVVSGSDLYAGGGFASAGGIAATNLAKWNGTNWSVVGTGLADGFFSSVHTLAVSGGDLYAGGWSRSGFLANKITKWNGANWLPVGSGMFHYDPETVPSVYALAVSGSNLFAGGIFTSAGGFNANNIAEWNGTGWSPVGQGMGGANPSVYALAASGSNLYAGGRFSTADGIPANGIARRNGSSWSFLGSGMGGVVYPVVRALVVSGSDLYAGGDFTTAGGNAANYIAKWNGSSWSALGSGMGGRPGITPVVYALAISGGELYAGGSFSPAGGIIANNIAKWNGSSWSALESGVNGPPGYPYYGGSVHALAVSGSDLYVGGYFTNAGGTTANNIAKWNGSSWSALGSGMDNAVVALAVSGSDLYAGGSFTNAGGINGNRIAKWDGSSWSALGSGMNGGSYPLVYALAVSGGNVYGGGCFTNAGGILANQIAKWNGSSWSALGSGMNDYVYALAVSASDLYAGGSFTNGGGKVSAYLAKARIGSIAKAVVPANSTASVEFSGVIGYQYDVQRTTNLHPPIPWTTVTPSPLSPAPDGSFTFTDTNAPPGTAYYRAVER